MRSGRFRAAVVDDPAQGRRRRRGAVDQSEQLTEHSGTMASSETAERLRGAAPLAFVGAALDLSRPQWKHGVRSLKRGSLRLFVHPEQQRVVGRVEIKPDHVDGLPGELRVLAQLEGLETMALDIGRPPNRVDGGRVAPVRPDGLPAAGMWPTPSTIGRAEGRTPSSDRRCAKPGSPLLLR